MLNVQVTEILKHGRLAKNFTFKKRRSIPSFRQLKRNNRQDFLKIYLKK